MTSFTSICAAVLMLMPLAVVAADKPTIVLLHGAFQDGNSTWHKVKPELEKHGYKVVVVNLPGRDGDGADLKTLSTRRLSRHCLEGH